MVHKNEGVVGGPHGDSCQPMVYNSFGTKTGVMLVFRGKVARLTRHVAQPFNSHATLLPNRALLYCVQLSRKDAER